MNLVKTLIFFISFSAIGQTTEPTLSSPLQAQTNPLSPGELTEELENKVANRIKDPFMLPNHLYLKIKKKTG